NPKPNDFCKCAARETHQLLRLLTSLTVKFKNLSIWLLKSNPTSTWKPSRSHGLLAWAGALVAYSIYSAIACASSKQVKSVAVKTLSLLTGLKTPKLRGDLPI